MVHRVRNDTVLMFNSPSAGVTSSDGPSGQFRSGVRVKYWFQVWAGFTAAHRASELPLWRIAWATTTLWKQMVPHRSPQTRLSSMNNLQIQPCSLHPAEKLPNRPACSSKGLHSGRQKSINPIVYRHNLLWKTTVSGVKGQVGLVLEVESKHYVTGSPVLFWYWDLRDPWIQLIDKLEARIGVLNGISYLLHTSAGSGRLESSRTNRDLATYMWRQCPQLGLPNWKTKPKRGLYGSIHKQNLFRHVTTARINIC